MDKIFSGRITQSELNKMLQAHEDFIGGIKGGRRLIMQFMNLSGLNFSGRKLADAVFTGSALIQADLSGCVLDRVNFFSCDLRFANFEGASLIKSDLRGVCARGARFNNADLFQADMREGQVLAHERSGELQALYIDVPAPAGNGLTDFSKAKMRRVRMNEAQASHTDFSEAEMHSVRMRNAHLSGANFSGANLEHGDFTGADMTRANMQDSVMMGVILTQAKMDGANTEGALRDSSVKSVRSLGASLDELIKEHQLWVETAGKKGRYLDLSGYDLRHVAPMKGMKLTAIKAERAVFLGMNLAGAELQHTYLDGADFRNALMMQTDFRGSSLKGAKMAKADLRLANFQPLLMGDGRTKSTDLAGVNLRYADLRGVDFKHANLKGADISFARVEAADFNHANIEGLIFDSIDAASAKGLPVSPAEENPA